MKARTFRFNRQYVTHEFSFTDVLISTDFKNNFKKTKKENVMEDRKENERNGKDKKETDRAKIKRQKGEIKEKVVCFFFKKKV